MTDTAVARIGREHYATTITFGLHTLVADEPAQEDGTDSGPSPTAMVLAGLAGCTAMTLRMVADRNQWPLDGVDVSVRSESSRVDDTTATVFHRHITLHGDLTEMQRESLLNVADACPIHRMLSGAVTVVSVED